MANKWQALKDHHAATAKGKILDLFAADPTRAAAFSVREATEAAQKLGGGGFDALSRLP